MGFNYLRWVLGFGFIVFGAFLVVRVLPPWLWLVVVGTGLVATGLWLLRQGRWF